MNLNNSPTDSPSEGYILPTGEERQRSLAMCQEVLAMTGNIIKEPALTDQQKDMRRMVLANRAAVLAIQDYYVKHPLHVNLVELRKTVLSCYMQEFSQWSKEDCIQMLSMQQALGCLKRFGYE